MSIDEIKAPTELPNSLKDMISKFMEKKWNEFKQTQEPSDKVSISIVRIGEKDGVHLTAETNKNGVATFEFEDKVIFVKTQEPERSRCGICGMYANDCSHKIAWAEKEPERKVGDFKGVREMKIRKVICKLCEKEFETRSEHIDTCYSCWTASTKECLKCGKEMYISLDKKQCSACQLKEKELDCDWRYLNKSADSFTGEKPAKKECDSAKVFGYKDELAERLNDRIVDDDDVDCQSLADEARKWAVEQVMLCGDGSSFHIQLRKQICARLKESK